MATKSKLTLEHILQVALNEPVIWVETPPSNARELAHYKPLGYTGSSEFWKFLVVRYELRPDRFNYDGTAIFEPEGVVIHIGPETAHTIFNKAHTACKSL